MEPMGCGVLWFVHIGKTGGSTATDYMRDHAPGGGWSFLELYDRTREFTVTGWNTTQAWRDILDQIYHDPQPRVIISQHHTSPGFGEYILPHLIEPWRRWLEPRGCAVVTSTLLRDPIGRTVSNIFYDNIPSDDVERFVNFHSNFMARYLIYTYQWPEWLRRSGWKASDEERLRRPAETALAGIDLVGRTSELSLFVATLDALLGWPGRPVGKHNTTPKRYKYELSEAQIQLIDIRTQVDNALYTSFCSSRCGSPSCDAALDNLADGYTCEARMVWLQSSEGGRLSESSACSKVAEQFSVACGACAVYAASPPPPPLPAPPPQTPAPPPPASPPLWLEAAFCHAIRANQTMAETLKCGFTRVKSVCERSYQRAAPEEEVDGQSGPDASQQAELGHYHPCVWHPSKSLCTPSHTRFGCEVHAAWRELQARSCAAQLDACSEAPFCCARENDGCYQINMHYPHDVRGQLTMCRPMPASELCVDTRDWLCPRTWLPPLLGRFLTEWDETGRVGGAPSPFGQSDG